MCGFNDCTAAPDGTVYVFSRRLAAVFRLRGGRFEAWATLDLAQTGAPNGLLAERDRLLLGSWWVRRDGTEALGHLSTVRYLDGAVGRLGDRPIGHIDGIEADGRGGYTVTDWTKGELLRVSADGVPTLLLTLRKGAADHTHVIDRGWLVVLGTVALTTLGGLVFGELRRRSDSVLAPMGAHWATNALGVLFGVLARRLG